MASHKTSTAEASSSSSSSSSAAAAVAPAAPLKRAASWDETIASAFKRSKTKKTKAIIVRSAGVDETINTLNACLERSGLLAAGRVCVGGHAPQLPGYPGLVVHERRIPLPLTDDETLAFLVSNSVASPHGRGLATVYDETVRKSRDIDPAHFRFENPAWESAVAAFARTVAAELGAGTSVEAHPYKLLLYREGDFFLRHRDTEKEDGMFATLVIQLASNCTGGALIAYHQRKTYKHTFGAGDTAAFGCNYCAHYADVEHEVEPLTNGQRLAVVYNIVWTGDRVAAPSLSHGEAVKQAVLVLQEWDSVQHPVLAMPLEHKYTELSAVKGLSCLKGRERAMLKFVQAVSKRLDDDDDVQVFLVNLKRVDMMAGNPGRGVRMLVAKGCRPKKCARGGAVSPSWEVVDTSRESTWYTESGVCLGTVIDSELIKTPGDANADFWGVGEDGNEEEYMGNSGPSKDTVYHRAMLVLLRSTQVVPFFMAASMDAAMALVAAGKDDAKKRRDALVLFDAVTSSPEAVVNSSDSIDKLITLFFSDGPTDAAFCERFVREYLIVGTQASNDSGDAFACASDLETFVKQLSQLHWNPPSLVDAMLELVVLQQQNTRYSYRDEQLPLVLLEALAEDVLSLSDDAEAVARIRAIIVRVWDSMTEDDGRVLVSYDACRICTEVAVASEWPIGPIADRVRRAVQSEGSSARHATDFVFQLLDREGDHAVAIARDCGKLLLSRPDVVEDVRARLPLAVRLGADDVAISVAETAAQKSLADVRRTISAVMAEGKSNFYPLQRRVLCLLHERLVHLLERAVPSAPPVFSWCMTSARTLNHPALQEFLRGPDNAFVMEGLGSISNARKLAKEYAKTGSMPSSRDLSGYSATFEAAGHGAKAYVRVQKTHDQHGLLESKYAKQVEERDEAREKLKTLNTHEEASAIFGPSPSPSPAYSVASEESESATSAGDEDDAS